MNSEHQYTSVAVFWHWKSGTAI